MNHINSDGYGYHIQHSLPRLTIFLSFFTGVFLDSPTEFTVDAKSVSPNGEGNVRAIVNNPSGVKNDTTVTNKGDGTYDVLYTPVEEGRAAGNTKY